MNDDLIVLRFLAARDDVQIAVVVQIAYGHRLYGGIAVSHLAQVP